MCKARFFQKKIHSSFPLCTIARLRICLCLCIYLPFDSILSLLFPYLSYSTMFRSFICFHFIRLYIRCVSTSYPFYSLQRLYWWHIEYRTILYVYMDLVRVRTNVRKQLQKMLLLELIGLKFWCLLWYLANFLEFHGTNKASRSHVLVSHWYGNCSNNKGIVKEMDIKLIFIMVDMTKCEELPDISRYSTFVCSSNFTVIIESNNYEVRRLERNSIYMKRKKTLVGISKFQKHILMTDYFVNC